MKLLEVIKTIFCQVRWSAALRPGQTQLPVIMFGPSSSFSSVHMSYMSYLRNISLKGYFVTHLSQI